MVKSALNLKLKNAGLARTSRGSSCWRKVDNPSMITVFNLFEACSAEVIVSRRPLEFSELGIQ